MNLLKIACTISFVVAACIPFTGNAQYQHRVAPFFSNFRNIQRYEIGGGLVMGSGDLTSVTTVYGPNNYYKGDSTITRGVTSQGFGGSLGLALPFKGTGHISCWAVTLHLMGNMNVWSDLNKTLSTNGSYTAESVSLNATTMQFALPIGIDYKIGNDAILTQRLPFTAALGVGIMPQFTMTTIDQESSFTSQYGGGFTPYAKVDLGFLAGICWKVRLSYSMGKINLLDVNHRIAGVNDGPVTLSQKSQFMASLILMPFSFKWPEYDWYNTYDTYNQHDRFN